MRYIKLYESIGGSYYQEISSNEYSIRASGNTDFTEEEEKKLIKKNWEKLSDSEIQKIMEHFPKKCKSTQEVKGRLIISYNNDEILLIIKLKDEWFLLYDMRWCDMTGGESEVYYKCDQLDGLKKLLTDNEYKTENY